jgi:NADH-quinone oxidoreductase subunit J
VATFFFFYFAGVIVATSILVVALRNPVYSALSLLIMFFHVAGLYVTLHAEFLAAVQVIVYAGAMLVLVLFTIMLVDPDNLPELHAGRPVQRIVGVLLGLILLLEVGLAIINRAFIGPGGNATPELIALVGGPAQAMGYILYNQYALPFEIVSLVLLVGVIGAIVLALPERLGEQFGLRRGTISLGHPRGTEVALPTGPDGEAPITAADRAATDALEGTRELILVRDPDKFTTIGERR